MDNNTPEPSPEISDEAESVVKSPEITIDEPISEDTEEPIENDPEEADSDAEPEEQYEPEEPRLPPEEAIFSINESYPEISEMLDAIASEYNCIAVSLVVYDGEERDYYAYQYGYGNIRTQRPINIDTKFRVASLAKFVVALCAMSLVEEGVLDLDADISGYIGYDVRNPLFPDIPITPRMLMQHISSIYDSSTYLSARNRNSTATVKRLLESGDCFEEWQPGEQQKYSNFGYSILGLICEIVSGRRFDTLAREILFEPLEIDAAFLPRRLIEKENIAAIYNADHTQRRSVQSLLDSGVADEQGSDQNQVPGNLMISIIDYTKILTLVGNGGILDDVRILSEETIKEIHDANFEAEWYRQGISTRYQDDVDMPFISSYWHTGSAYGVFAQYIYFMGNGENRGVTVVTTGARTGRLENGMVEVCTDLSTLAWQILE